MPGVDLGGKLQLKAGPGVFVGAEPPDVVLDLPDTVADPASAEAVLVFAVDRAGLERWRRDLTAAANRDALAWVAYPKGGALRTDLNRDIVGRALEDAGLRPVRQIAIDGVWSALRFRRA